MNSKLERMWKEMVVALFKVVSQHLPRKPEENREKPVRIARTPTEILTPHLPNTSNKPYCFRQLACLGTAYRNKQELNVHPWN
jgi:hypothetical protein